jgi:hypothetical protein
MIDTDNGVVRVTALTKDEEALRLAMTSTAVGRKRFITDISCPYEGNWQDVATPYDIVREMLDLVPDATHYAVLFSMEFLEVLVKERNVSPDRIVFFADSDREARMARHQLMYGVKTVLLQKDEIITADGFDKHAFIRQLTQGVSEMKFDNGKLCIVQNPPYQTDNDKGGGTTHASALYHKFIETLIDGLNPNYLVTICPSRWMVGGRGLDAFRERMLNDKRIQKMSHFQGHKDVFPAASIQGGVSYFLWNKAYSGPCEFNGMERELNEFDVVVLDNQAIPILRKVLAIDTHWCNKSFAVQTPFGIISSFNDWKESGTTCYSQGWKKHFVNPQVVSDKHAIASLWKVATSKADRAAQHPDANANGAKRVFSYLYVLEPGAVCTQTYIIVNAFKTKKEAENFISYMKTKFFRFMLGIRLNTQSVSKENFAFVPDLEDYSAPWTDEELYKKFNLTRQERAYVESKIKELK